MTKKAKPDTWMPLVIGTYLKNTGRLTTEQHGAYLLLIMDYWVNGPPADDDEDLASITKLDAKAWKRHRPKLQAFFEVTDGRWRHATIEAELADWTQKRAKFSERAAAGGRAKAAKSKTPSTAESTAQSSALSTAKSTPKSTAKPVRKGCSPSPTTEEEGAFSPNSSLSEAMAACSSVPIEVREAFLRHRDLPWVCSYVDRCVWIEEGRILVPATQPARAALQSDGRRALRELADAGQAVTIQEAPPLAAPISGQVVALPKKSTK